MLSPPSNQVTRLLAELEVGDARAWAQLVPAIDRELRRIARSRLPRGACHSLRVTDLVQETYVRLLRRDGGSWQDRRHFYRVVAKAMQGLLVDHLRRRVRLKRGGGRRVTLRDDMLASDVGTESSLLVHEALDRLAEEDPRQHEIVMLRYFHGLGIDEVARLVGVSPATVDRQWRFARAWLRRQLDGAEVAT